MRLTGRSGTAIGSSAYGRKIDPYERRSEPTIRRLSLRGRAECRRPVLAQGLVGSRDRSPMLSGFASIGDGQREPGSALLFQAVSIRLFDRQILLKFAPALMQRAVAAQVLENILLAVGGPCARIPAFV